VILLEPNSEKPLKNIIRNLPGYSILVGPEGGFTQEEKEFFLYLGAEAFNLGKRILRLETAAAVSLFFLQEINRD